MAHPILARLRHPDPTERRAACLAAPEDPAATLLLDALGETLGDPVKSVSRAASDALAAIGRRERHVETVLRTALRSDSPGRRFAAAYTSVRLGPPTPTLLPALVDALASPDGDVRWSAARMLVDLGRLHGEVLGVLVGLVRAGDAPVVRRMASFALRELAPDRPEAARVLVDGTRDSAVHVRRAAFSALASLLDPPPEVSARLLEAVEHEPDLACRRIAAVALGELGISSPGSLAPDFRARLERLAADADDPDLRRAAERALLRLARPPDAGPSDSRRSG
ncbi:MAG TPA: HEAT repeat domain-containing protein [Myxococcota bacterium]|jgi:HEAT repeat protein|nr:HEAT repeat domain-containing protein [Myxococcota bacterium]